MLGLLVQTSAFGAACSPNSCSGQISTLVAEADGNVYVAMVGGLGGLTSCTPDAGDQPFLTLPAASANLKLIYATLLAAQMTGRPVTIHVAANSQGCTIRYVTSP
ncbi:MAG: hypothetical protein JOZ67_07325 [Gammaproteobacteria bacterium]|nr:hypothetical protein [Gammaproteobacteria bacterium]MBV9697007.1 hypothetical protein [Gammaproteobacteria bacterium]